LTATSTPTAEYVTENITKDIAKRRTGSKAETTAIETATTLFRPL
jgi:hypothetical protein